MQSAAVRALRTEGETLFGFRLNASRRKTDLRFGHAHCCLSGSSRLETGFDELSGMRAGSPPSFPARRTADPENVGPARRTSTPSRRPHRILRHCAPHAPRVRACLRPPRTGSCRIPIQCVDRGCVRPIVTADSHCRQRPARARRIFSASSTRCVIVPASVSGTTLSGWWYQLWRMTLSGLPPRP